MQVQRHQARVTVRFSSEEREVDMVFPLEASDGTWHIQEQITFSTTIDIIPAEPQ